LDARTAAGRAGEVGVGAGGDVEGLRITAEHLVDAGRRVRDVGGLFVVAAGTVPSGQGQDAIPFAPGSVPPFKYAGKRGPDSRRQPPVRVLSTVLFERYAPSARIKGRRRKGDDRQNNGNGIPWSLY